MNNLVNHPIKDHGYTREYVMKPEMQEKIKSKIKKTWKYVSAAGSPLVNAKTLMGYWIKVSIWIILTKGYRMEFRWAKKENPWKKLEK